MAALDGFLLGTFSHAGKERAVYRSGQGPAVVVISEIPGITPKVAELGRRVADLGCTAVLPSLFGEPGKAPSVPYAAGVGLHACISRELTTLALRRTSPVTEWLRALARHEHAACGGPGVGVVGMCLTGGFALAMMVDDIVLAPVLSQPSLPLPVSKGRRRDLGVSDADLARVKQRCAAEPDLCLLGLRFTGDKLVPAERFERLGRELGDHFLAVEIDSSPGNPHGNRTQAHSVLTEDLVDEPGHPTRDALQRVLDHFRGRLLP